MSSASTVGPVASPCTSVCRISTATGFCEGCLRSIDEIVAWGQMTEAAKHNVIELVSQRKASHAA
jgi:uncharacterized protein